MDTKISNEKIIESLQNENAALRRLIKKIDDFNSEQYKEIIALLQTIYKEIDTQKSIDNFSLNRTYTVDIDTINEIFNKKIQKILDDRNTDKVNLVKINKTRQDRFLQQYPKANFFDLLDFTGEDICCLSICPLDVDCFLSRDRCKKSCIDCKKSYWFAEVDENE